MPRLPRPCLRALRAISAAVLIAMCSMAPSVGTVAAQADGPTSRREAQRRLEKLQRELNTVAAERRALENRRGDASRALRRMDERLADTSRALNAAESELAREQHALQELDARRTVLRGQEVEHRRALAALLRAAYAQGERAPLELALAQDRIADADRQLTYYGYLQRHRLQRTRTLAAELAELERVERQIVEKRSALDAARADRARQQAALTRDRAAHAAELDALERRYSDRRARERALGSDAKALQTLVERLRVAAARAAAERAAAERAARAAARKTASERGTARVAQSKRGVQAAAKPPQQTAKAAPVRVGGYGWPASGTLLAGFGGRMPDGRTSNGLLIAAGLGAPVRAVADGTVVFAEWMTGYGLILIVDHGNGTHSLYAHNESLLKNAGDAVSRGDVVARVGNSGGLPQPGLYFELRRNGQPVNPAGWLGRQ